MNMHAKGIPTHRRYPILMIIGGTAIALFLGVAVTAIKWVPLR